MFKFLRRGDEIESAVANAISNILEETPNSKAVEFEMNDVLDMIHGLPPVETVLEPEFFSRPTLHFRLFRRCLDLH